MHAQQIGCVPRKVKSNTSKFRLARTISLTGIAIATVLLLNVIAANPLVNFTTRAASAVAPSITITAPANNATFTAPATVTITAQAGADSSAIDFVDFTANGQGIGRAVAPVQGTTNTYSITYTFTVAGTYRLIAIATDTGGVQASSAPVTITIQPNPNNQPPTISLITPANPSVYEAGTDITFTADARDADGQVVRVEYFINNVKVGEAATAPYAFTTRLSANPSYTVTARATDNDGASTTSTVARITVVPQGAFNPPVTPDNSPIPTNVPVVYVDILRGNNTTGTGTIDNPVQTINRALALATVPGTNVVLRAGTYRGGISTLPRRLVIRSFPNERVVLKGSQEITGWQFDPATGLYSVSFPSQQSAPPTGGDSNVDFTQNPFSRLNEQLFINGRPLTQVARTNQGDNNFIPQDCTGGVVRPGTFCLDYGANRTDASDNRLFIRDDPTNSRVEATTIQTGFFSATTNEAAGVAIRGLVLMHFGQQAILINSTDAVIEGNTLAWNGLRGLNIQRPDTTENNTTANPAAVRPNSIVRRNNFSYNGRLGVISTRQHNLLFEDNYASYNNIERFSTAFDAAGVKFLKADDQIFRYNTLENNLASGLWLDVSITDATVVGNYANNNLAIGIFFEVSSRAILAFNLATGNDVGMRVSGSNRVRVFNNTLADNGRGGGRALWIFDSNRVNTVANGNTNQAIVDAEVAAGIDWETYDVTIKNNILAEAFNALSFSGVLDIEDGACGSVGAPCRDTGFIVNQLNFNVYFRTNPNSPARLVRWRPTGVATPENTPVDRGFTNLDAFRTTTGNEPNGIELSGASIFINRAANNYRVRYDSPVIGAGEPLSEDVANTVGLEPGTPITPGAIQDELPYPGVRP